MSVVVRERKSDFVRLFDKTPTTVRCPHFHELVLSNGCPFDCSYCYLHLTFRGKKSPVLFSNPWESVEDELGAYTSGVFSTGELADSLAIVPRLLPSALRYFSRQQSRYLLLVTKSTNLAPLLEIPPSPQVIVSFSVNSEPAARAFEKRCPAPARRLQAAQRLITLGWRIRIRLDPVILETGLEHYRDVCRRVADLAPERVTVGSLRQYVGVHNYSPTAPRVGLRRASDGRLRYPVEVRAEAYTRIAEWLGFRPALCKESLDLWQVLGWEPGGCNCTV